jgi:DNA polymerase V
MPTAPRFSQLTRLLYGALPILRCFEPPIPCGFPSPAEDYLEKPLDLNEILLRHPESTFAFRVVGDSMKGVGIHSGDVVVVDRAGAPAPGEIVIAALNGEWTLKTFGAKDGKLHLLPENTQDPAFRPIPVDELADFRVFGVVRHVIHSFKRNH